MRHGKNTKPYSTETRYRISVPRVTPAEALANIERLAGGTPVTEADLIAASPVRIPDAPYGQTAALISALFRPGEIVSLVLKSWRDGEGRGRPGLPECAAVSEGLCWYFREAAAPGSKGSVKPSEFGCWFRTNPVKSTKGSGNHGAYRDVDVASCRHLLLEADGIPIAAQLKLFSRLPLPIAALVDSAGRSIHAIVRIEEIALVEFKAIARSILRDCAQYGIDPSNAHPSCMARLPGFRRYSGPREAGTLQRLLYLNPDPDPSPIISGEPVETTAQTQQPEA